MNGVYAALLAIYFLILAVKLDNKRDFLCFLKGLFFIISFVTLIVSVPVQICL